MSSSPPATELALPQDGIVLELRPLQSGIVVLGHAARGLLVVLLAWQLAIWLLDPPAFLLPSPMRVFMVLGERADFLLHHAALTSVEIVLGLLFGTLAGCLVALSSVALPAFGTLVWPGVLVLQAMPVFALAPLLVLWFGFGLASKVVMASLIIFFPVASAFADGLRRTDPAVLESAALLGASRQAVLWRLRVPLALPSLLTGLRVAAPLAPLGAVIGEWVGASGGLGFIMLQANARMQSDILFAALFVLAAQTLLLRFLVDRLATRIAPWAPER